MDKGQRGTYLLIFAAGVLLTYLIVGSNHNNEVSKYEQQLALEQASKDSLVTVYNKKTAEWESSKQAYVAEKEVLDNYLQEKEQELAKLRKKGAGVGIVIDTETKVDTTVKNIPYVELAGVTQDTNLRYAKIDRLPHYEAEVFSYPDSTRIKLAAYVKLTPSIDESTGRITVTHNNPYVTVTGLNGFQVQPKKQKSKFWRGVAVGGAVVGGILILSK